MVNNIMDNNILIWGASSQSLIAVHMIKKEQVFLDGKKTNESKVTCIIDPFLKQPTYKIDVPFINTKKKFLETLNKVDSFLVCIASHHGKARTFISERLMKKNLNSISIISSNAYIDETANLGKGLQIMPKSVIHCFSEIGDFTIINTSSTIDHECKIGKGCHIMGGASIAGRVKVGNFVTIGTNSTILPDIKIEEGAFIGAGSVVNRDIKKNEVVVGNPAKFLKKNIHKFDISFF